MLEEVKSNIEKYLSVETNGLEKDTKKIIYRNIKSKNYYINFISLVELRKNIRISISFSYSRFEKDDNYNLCENEKIIDKVHKEISKVFKLIAGKPVTLKDLRVGAIDISNQLEVSTISSYYKVLDLIYRALRNTEQNGRLYLDTDSEKRKQLDGLDFREQGKKRREASSYFKIYSKFKEEQQTGKSTAGHIAALRGELTLKGRELKKHHLGLVAGINREYLNKILFDSLAVPLAGELEKELNYSIKHLSSLLQENKTKKIREILTINEHHIFDVKVLDIILTPENIGVSERQCRTYKKQIREILKEIETQGEIKKVFTGNFERLEKLVKKIAKAELIIIFENGGVSITWQK